MVRKKIAAGVGVAALLVLGLRTGWAPFVAPAGADPTRTRQAVAEETFAFRAVVPPGSVVLLDRPPAGNTFLVTDVLVQNVPVGGELVDLSPLGKAERSAVTVGSASSRGPTVDARSFTGTFEVRVTGEDLEQVHLQSGFTPVGATRGGGDRLAVFNSQRASAVAFVQIYGRLLPLTP